MNESTICCDSFFREKKDISRTVFPLGCELPLRLLLKYSFREKNVIEVFIFPSLERLLF